METDPRSQVCVCVCTLVHIYVYTVARTSRSRIVRRDASAGVRVAEEVRDTGQETNDQSFLFRLAELIIQII